MYSFLFSSKLFNLNLQEPNAPPGVDLRELIAELLSFDVSINSSFSAPRIPFFPA